MKLLRLPLLFVILFTLVLLWKEGEAAVTMEQLNTAANMMRTSCIRKTKISDEHADGLRVGQFPEDKAVKCYVQCVLEMLQLMKKAKVLWAPVVVDTFIPDELKDTFVIAYEKCLHISDGISDKCEAGYEFLKCFHKHNPKYFFA